MSSQIAQSREPFFKAPRQFKQRGPNGFPIGPRTIERQKQNAKLNKLPDSVKRRCEIQLPGCLHTLFLSWAHDKKSRFILTDKDWQTAARACGFCHDQLDHHMNHAEMKRLVNKAIAKRKPHGD